MKTRKRSSPEPRHASIDKKFRAVCPWKPCKGRSEIGAWAIAHLYVCTMNGNCSKCGKPITIGRDDH